MGDDGRNTTEKTWSDDPSPQKKRKVEAVTSLNAAATKNHKDACATDLIPFSGIPSNDSPFPDTIFSNAAGTVFHTNIPIESFPRPDNVFSEFESAAIAKTLNN